MVETVRTHRLAMAVVVTIAVAAIPADRVAAQPETAADEDGGGSIACYVQAERIGLERRSSIELCIGARSTEPAQCFADAVDELALSDRQAVRLCRAATSIEPAACAARLEASGFEDGEIVRYCAALAYPLVPAGTAGAPACVQAGLDRTFLTEREIIRLCRGSTTAAPIDCFEAGDDQTFLSERDIVRLCAAVVPSAPTVYQPYRPY